MAKKRRRKNGLLSEGAYNSRKTPMSVSWAASAKRRGKYIPITLAPVGGAK